MNRLNCPDWGRTKVIAEKFGVTKKWLDNERWKGTGPPYSKVGGLVLYHIPTVQKWLEDRTISSTSEEGLE